VSIIESFDSIDDMFNAMREDEMVADSKVSAKQREIDVGDVFMRLYAPDLIIYGKVVATHKEKTLFNYPFCFCFSEACKVGEYGDVHRSVMVSITAQIYENARKMYGTLEPDYNGLFQYAEEDGLVLERGDKD